MDQEREDYADQSPKPVVVTVPTWALDAIAPLLAVAVALAVVFLRRWF